MTPADLSAAPLPPPVLIELEGLRKSYNLGLPNEAEGAARPDLACAAR